MEMTREREKHQRAYMDRIRRIKRLLKPLPRRSNIGRYPFIKRFADAARSRPFLWSFKRRYVIRAIYIGSVLSILPIYGVQIIIAFAAAVFLRANLTVTIALQMITNPLTAGPIYYATYKLGMFLIEMMGYGEGIDSVTTKFNALFLGGFVGGLLMAVVFDILYRIGVWEAQYFKRLRERYKAAKQKEDETLQSSERADD